MFEPHRYSRTRELFSEFLNSFSDCDELYLTEIYPAGEEPLSGVSGEILALAIQHPKVTFAPNLRELFNELRPNLRPGDILVTLGAGGITQLAHSFAAELSENSSVLPPLTANISAVQPARLHSPLTNGSLEAASQHVTE